MTEANLCTFFYTSMIRLQYIHVTAKNFTTNCLRHIILFNIFHVLYKLDMI
jgi:hypothetical protein